MHCAEAGGFGGGFRKPHESCQAAAIRTLHPGSHVAHGAPAHHGMDTAMRGCRWTSHEVGNLALHRDVERGGAEVLEVMSLGSRVLPQGAEAEWFQGFASGLKRSGSKVLP